MVTVTFVLGDQKKQAVLKTLFLVQTVDVQVGKGFVTLGVED